MRKKDQIQRSQEISFTGERMIPKLNQGKTFYYEHLLRYLFSLQFIQNKKVLDAGCGSGYGTRMLYELGGKEITGTDISKVAIEYATTIYGRKGVRFMEANVEKLPDFKEKFEVIVAFEILEHLSDQVGFLKGVRTNLKPGGIFLVSTPNKFTYPSGNQFHIKELLPNEFEKLLKKYFTYVYLFNQQFLFSNSLQSINKKNNLDLNFIQEKYVKDGVVSVNPSIDIKESRYLVAVCSNQQINNIHPYCLNTFKADEFSLFDGVEGMSKMVIDSYKDWIENDEEIKELKRAFNEITSSRFYRLWQFYCRFKELLKKKIR